MRPPQLAALLLVLLTTSPRARAARPKYKGQTGQVSTYTFTLSARTEVRTGSETQTIASLGSLQVVQKIVKVDEQGPLTVQVSFNQGKLLSSSEGRTVSLPLKLPSVETVMTDTGNVLSAELIGEASTEPTTDAEHARHVGPGVLQDFPDLFAEMRPLGFPDREVQVGDSWSLSSSVKETGGETVRVVGESRLVSVENRRGKSCAVVQSEIKAPVRSTQDVLGVRVRRTGTRTVMLTTYFDLEGGRVLEVLGTERRIEDCEVTAPHGEASHSGDLHLDSTATFTMVLNER